MSFVAASSTPKPIGGGVESKLGRGADLQLFRAQGRVICMLLMGRSSQSPNVTWEWGGDSRGAGRERTRSLILLAELTGKVRGPYENSQACKARVHMLTSHSPLRCINR